MATSIHSEIKINASREIIWNILMDFDQFPSWNPFIKSIKGSTQVGEKLDVLLDDMRFKPTVLVNKEFRQFKWLGHLMIPGIFDGSHNFELIENDEGGVTFIQSEDFKGILVPLLKKKLMTETLNQFKSMNTALKNRAEQLTL